MLKLLRKLLRSKRKILLILTFAILIISTICLIKFRDVIYLKYYSFLYTNKDFIFNSFKIERLNIDQKIIYKSNCECRKYENIILNFNYKNGYYRIFNNKSKEEHKISQTDLDNSIFTCKLYNVLRRGPKTKVISFALYGKNRFYYNYIRDLIKFIYLNYPNWSVRVYYDSTIDKSIICELECYNYKNEIYLDIVDTCNIEQMPIDLFEKNTWDASYMHGMTWRWLPLGDSFVDYFSSRDTDAWMSKREVDSVNVWLKSNTLFHVMRGFISNFI